MAIILAALALGAGGSYLWARGSHSVAVLDRVDSLFTGRAHAVHARFGDDPAQQVYVYGQDGQDRLPVMVFIHGGGWAEGDPADYGFIARNFAPRGYVVVLAGYRLGAKGRFPAMLEDGAAALAWVHAHIAEFGGDPDRIVLMGHSAGAYNAAMIALDPQWLAHEGLGPGIIRGVVGLAGPYDFYPFDVPSSRAAFGGWSRPEETQPVRFARADAPPMLLLTGTDDKTVRPHNSQALAHALNAAGAAVREIEFAGKGHAGILMALARPFDFDPAIKDATLDFLAARSAKDTTSAPVQPENR